MNILIDRIIELSGPLPDEALHRRWLHTLRGDQLQERAKTLEEESGRPETPAAHGKFRQFRQGILLRT